MTSAPADLHRHRAHRRRHREPVLHLAGPRGRGRHPGRRLLARALQQRRRPGPREQLPRRRGIRADGRGDPRADQRPLRPEPVRAPPHVRRHRRPRAAQPPVDAVAVDNVAGGRTATARLYERGARRVACITGPRAADTAELRSAGWRQEFRRSCPTADPDAYLEHADYRVDGGRAAMARLLDAPDPPDAVFVANNLMAVGALAELRSRGLQPPSFGVAAYGDLPYMPLGPSGVEVIPMPTRLIGATAATVLLERIKGSTEPLRTVVLRNESD
ncbi:substrate-binding domain-containing protein [Actinomycetes bacterium KLBMP 9759]